MKKYYLAEETKPVLDSLRYVEGLHLRHALSSFGIPFTRSSKEDYDEVLAPSGEDYAACASRIPSEKKVSLLAASELLDFSFRKGNVVLSDVADIAYRKASRLLVYTQEQENFLRNRLPSSVVIQKIPFVPTYPDRLTTSEEKWAFRSYFRIPRDGEVYLTYGNYQNQQEYVLFEHLARLCPDKYFLFFGNQDRDFITTQALLQAAYPKNIRFFGFLPEELYHSAIESVDGLILTSPFLAYPAFLLDLMSREVPLLRYFYPSDFASPSDETLVAKDFLELYQDFIHLKTVNHVKQATAYLEEMRTRVNVLE